MEISETFMSEKRSIPFLVKFIVFVLIFSLVTLAMQFVFRWALNWSGRNFGTAVALKDSEGEEPKRIVVLDAGHGGEDGGTSSESGTLEKDLNLSVTLHLADYLRAAGIEVVLTRDTDRLLYDPNSDFKGKKKMLDLRTRLDIAKAVASEHENAEVIFISIHMNSYPQKSVKGLQVWYSPNHANSLSLAETIQNTARTLLGEDNDRSVKRAGSNIYLLDRAEIPSVLVECGFLSNPEDAAKLSDEKYRRELAFVLFTAVMHYIPPEATEITDSIVPLTP